MALLWESRRIGHALCISPVDEEFILNSSEHFEELSNLDFWTRCLRDFQPLVIGFQQNFSFLFADLSRGSYNHRDSFQMDIKVDNIRKAALELMSSVSLFNQPSFFFIMLVLSGILTVFSDFSFQVPDLSQSAFLSGCLYYDLCPRLISSGQLTEVRRCGFVSKYLCYLLINFITRKLIK